MMTAYLLGFSLFLTFFLGALKFVSIERVLQNYPWGILIILISLELFSKLIERTKVVEVSAAYLGIISRGNKLFIMIIFSTLLFFASSILNNITAVIVVLPVIFTLMEFMSLNQQYAVAFFSLLLSISNLAGASTPIGDFPAIVIMKSNLTTFTDYLIRAFPLFFTSALIIFLYHVVVYKLNASSQDKEISSQDEIVTRFMKLQYMNYKIERIDFIKILVVFTLMFFAWVFLPPELFPPEIIAITGVIIAIISLKKSGEKTLKEPFQLTTTLTLGSYLLIASLVHDSGILFKIGDLLLKLENNPRILLLSIMVTTGILTGMFSAGPTAAALIPLIEHIASNVFPENKDWLAIAFATSICAGSSLFLHSASAGPILSERVSKAKLYYIDSSPMIWNWLNYFRFGLIHFVIQISIGIVWVFFGMGLLQL